MENEVGPYYTAERWQNWLERLREEDLDPEDEDSARLLLNLQDDTAIAVAKILTDFDEGELDAERAMDELTGIEEVVLAEAEFEDEETAMLLDGVQTSLLCVLYAAEEFVAEGPVDGSIPEQIEAAAAAEQEEDLDAALGHCVQAGTLVIDGEEFDRSVAEELEFGLVAELVNGLDSLQNALEDPEVVEED